MPHIMMLHLSSGMLGFGERITLSSLILGEVWVAWHLIRNLSPKGGSKQIEFISVTI